MKGTYIAMYRRVNGGTERRVVDKRFLHFYLKNLV